MADMSAEKIQEVEKTKGKKKPAKQSLPVKTRKLIKVIVENPGISQKEAGKLAGYKHASSTNRALMKANPTFLEKMDEAGLTEETLLEHTAAGLKAGTKREELKKSEDGLTETKVEVEVPDFMMRHRYLDTAWKLRGKLREGNVTNHNTLIVTDREATIENIRKSIGS